MGQIESLCAELAEDTLSYLKVLEGGEIKCLVNRAVIPVWLHRTWSEVVSRGVFWGRGKRTQADVLKALPNIDTLSNAWITDKIRAIGRPRRSAGCVHTDIKRRARPKTHEGVDLPSAYEIVE